MKNNKMKNKMKKQMKITNNGVFNKEDYENEKRKKEIQNKIYSKTLKYKDRRAKKIKRAEINRDKYAQLNVKMTKRNREENADKKRYKIYHIPDKYKEMKSIKTNGSWKEGTKINTTRSKWEKIKEPEENYYWQKKAEFETYKNLITKKEDAVILVDKNNKCEIYYGEIEFRNNIYGNETIKTMKIKCENKNEYVEVKIKNLEFNERIFKKFEIEEEKVDYETLLNLAKNAEMEIYEISEIVEKKEDY